MNKRGQFYFIAAIIIVSIMASFVLISNYATSQSSPNIYYLRDEISIESSKVIDYGIYNNFNSLQIQGNLTSLAEAYINESQNENLYFLLGNSTNMTLVAYQTVKSNLTIEGVHDYTDLIGTGSIYSQSFTPQGGGVTAILNGNIHVFDINLGENFFFIISNEKGGQNYTISSQ
ncbi:MAG: hypothetical protein KGH55_01345 [Nanoarchaeota archaeon]|nr:hypothetical protein [Nanoarchaeota archaeon]